MATGTRSLPTNSPVPYFQPIERGHMTEGRLSDMDSQEAVFARGMQIPPQHVSLQGTTEIQVVLDTILLLQSQRE